MTFKVKIPKNIEPGSYDVRVIGYYGISSPKIFKVGIDLEHNSETTGKNNSIENAQDLKLESVANGKIQKPFSGLL